MNNTTDVLPRDLLDQARLDEEGNSKSEFTDLVNFLDDGPLEEITVEEIDQLDSDQQGTNQQWPLSQNQGSQMSPASLSPNSPEYIEQDEDIEMVVAKKCTSIKVTANGRILASDGTGGAMWVPQKISLEAAEQVKEIRKAACLKRLAKKGMKTTGRRGSRGPKSKHEERLANGGALEDIGSPNAQRHAVQTLCKNSARAALIEDYGKMPEAAREVMHARFELAWRNAFPQDYYRVMAEYSPHHL